MQGIFLQTARDMVLQKFGSKFWKKLSSSAHLPEDFDQQKVYDEDILVGFIRELSKTLGIAAGNKNIIEAIGYWFFHFAKNAEYGKAFAFLGPKFSDALRNLNQVSSALSAGQQQSLLPSVRCSIDSDAGAKLQIFSSSGKETRKQAAAFTVGMLKAIAEEMYSINNITVTAVERERDANCDEFRVSWSSGESAQQNGPSGSPAVLDSPSNASRLAKRETATTATISTATLSIGLPPAQLATLFPFHFIFNRHMEFVQCGPSLAKILGASGAPGKKLVPLFQIAEPTVTQEWTFQDAENWTSDMIAFRFTVEREGKPVASGEETSRNTPVAVVLRGQLLQFKTTRIDGAVIGFFGSPHFRGSDAASLLGLHFSDFALHDTAKEALWNTPESLTKNGSTAKKASVKDRSQRVDPKDVKEKASSLGVLRVLLGSKYEDTAFEVNGSAGQSDSKKAVEVPAPAGKVEPLIGEDIISARRASASSTATTNSNGSASTFSIVETVGDSQQGFSSRISIAFQELLVQDSWHRFQITQALLRAANDRSSPKESEELTQSLVRFYGYRSRLSELVAAVLEEEIAMATSSTTNASVFLRTDSNATKTLGALVELYDDNAAYMKLCLGPYVAALESVTTEDSSRVLKLAQSIVDVVCKSSSYCPTRIRCALSMVREKASRSIPELANTGVVNILLLRYINPALVNPERYKLVSKRPSPAQQKLGLAVAKLIQALVNAAVNEKFSPVPDSLLTIANREAFHRFITELTSELALAVGPQVTTEPSWLESPLVATQSLGVIRDWMIRHTAEIFAAIQSSDASAASLRNGLQQFLTVCLMEVQPTTKKA